MAHYSEMDFIFNIKPGEKKEVTKILDNTNWDNTLNIFNVNKYVVYKNKDKSGTGNIIKYYKEKLQSTKQNPYTKLLTDFSERLGSPGAGLRIKAADLAYLRDLGVYPINRMAILRRFPEGHFVPEDLNEMKMEPISTIIGWIKPDQNFGTVGFNETWTKTTDRFDQLLTKIVRKAIGIEKTGPLIPIPDFAQGMLFEFYKKLGLTERSDTDEGIDEYESYNPSTKGASDWGLSRIPVGDPNVLQEGPFRDPEGQNIQSDFTFELETTYEQKILGDVDPGSAMLDILDNIYAMGTSNMTFYWGDQSSTIRKAMEATNEKANNLNEWWDFVADIMQKMWETITDLFRNLYEEFAIELQLSSKNFKEVSEIENNTQIEIAELEMNLELESNQIERERILKQIKEKQRTLDIVKKVGTKKLTKEINSTDKNADTLIARATFGALENIQKLLQSVLTSTIAIYRFQIRGSIELMTGGKFSSTPWYLTLGNPYTPWLATNHIIVKSASIESSNEMGFNDQPQRITAKFTCQFSRALGKQELMRMFNNSFRRTYTKPDNLQFSGEKAELREDALYRTREQIDGNFKIATRGTPNVIGNDSQGQLGLKGL